MMALCNNIKKNSGALRLDSRKACSALISIFKDNDSSVPELYLATIPQWKKRTRLGTSYRTASQQKFSIALGLWPERW
jgi:hypothetical protein